MRLARLGLGVRFEPGSGEGDGAGVRAIVAARVTARARVGLTIRKDVEAVFFVFEIMHIWLTLGSYKIFHF